MIKVKLNNRGWGLGMFLALLSTLVVAIFLIWYGSFEINKMLKKLKDNNEYYYKLENNIESSTEIFLNDNPISDCHSIGCTINYDLLKANNYISKYSDKTTNNECTGCVKVIGNTYKAYISCDSYKTENYSCVK